MKKIFIAMCMMLIFASCANETEDQPKSDCKMVDVTFDVSAFDVSDEPITRAASSAGSVLQEIEYVLKGTTSDFMVRGTQTNDPGEPAFGKFTARLPEGSYDLHVWAIGKKNADGTAMMIKAGSVEDPFNIRNEIESFDKDLFSIPLTRYEINASTPTIKCELQRLTSKMTIQILDKLPEDVVRVSAGFYYQRYYRPYGSAATSQEMTYATKDLVVRPDGSFEDLETYMFPERNTKVKFTLFNDKNLVIGKAEMSAPTYKNRNTIVRGNLFDLIAGKDFDVTVNDIWGEDNIIDMNK